jgi:F-type H+-transporting ATPase subunit b
MPAFLQMDPGLIIWTLVNFGIFAFIIAKFAWKPMITAIQAREQTITDNIKGAEAANAEAQQVLKESKDRIAAAQQEMMDIVKEGRVQAETILRRAAEEAEVVKQQKLSEAQREIERQKDDAIAELRAEVTALVIGATEKLIGTKLDGEDHKRIIQSSVNELSKN